EGFGCGFAYAFDGAEGREELVDRLRADARDVEQLGVQRLELALLALERDGEAVGLVAEALQELERSARPPDEQRLAVAGEVNLFEPLGQAHDGEAAVDL